MNYDVVSCGAKNAIGGFFRNPEQFEQGLKTFYREGRKNPSVAMILMHDEAIQNAKKCTDIQKKLSREYDEYVPMEKLKPEDLIPKGPLPFWGIGTKMLAEAAAYGLNKMSSSYGEYFHKTNIYVKMLINHERMSGAVDILDNPGLPKSAEKEAFEKEFNTLYPRTGAIRKKLIKYNIRKGGKTTLRMPKEKRHYVTMSDEELFSTDPNTGRLKLDIIEGKEPKKPSFITTKNLFKSKKRLNQERETAIEQRKEEYETDKLIRAISPL